jgi:hypothetical protein
MSRRSVLRGAAGAGAAGLAMTVLPATALAAARTDSHLDASHDTSAHDDAGDSARDSEDVVVHVRDLRRGEMDVYRGTSHVRVTDRDLAARLARASR